MKEHIERVLESLRQKSDLLSFSESAPKERPYVAVHAKKGTHETHATSSYEAAKKAAAHWKLKSTAGIDSHPADVKHIATEEVDLEEGNDPYVSSWNKSLVKRIKSSKHPEHVKTNLLAKAKKSKSASDAELVHQELDKMHEEVEQIDEGTMQKQKSDFTSPKYRYRSDAPHMGSYKLRAGTYRTGDDSYDDKDETKVSHKQGREMTKKLRSAPSAEEKSRLWNKFWKTGSMKEEVELEEGLADVGKKIVAKATNSDLWHEKMRAKYGKPAWDTYWKKNRDKGILNKVLNTGFKEEVELDENWEQPLHVLYQSHAAFSHAPKHPEFAKHMKAIEDTVEKKHGKEELAKLKKHSASPKTAWYAKQKLPEEVEQIDESNEENARAKVRETHSQILKKGYKYIGSEQRSVGKDDSLVTHNYLSKDGSHIHHMQYSPYTMTGKGGPHIFHKKTKFNAKLHDHLTEQCFNYFDEARNTYKLYDDHKDFAKAHADIDAAVKNAHNDPTAVKKAMRKHAKVGAEDSQSRDTIHASIKRRHGAEVARKTKIGLWEDAEQIDEGPFTGIGKMMMKSKLKKQVRAHNVEKMKHVAKAILRKNVVFRDKTDPRDGFAKEHDEARRKQLALNRLNKEEVDQIDEGTKADIKAAAQVGKFEKHNAIQAAKAAGAPFKGPYKDAKGDVQDKSGAKHTAMSRAKHLAKMAAKKNAKLKEAVSDATTPTQAQATVAGKMSSLAQSIKSKKKTGKDEFDANPEFVSQVQPNASNY